MLWRALAVGLLLAFVVSPRAEAAVTEENFEARTTGDLLALCGVSPADANANAAIHFCHGFLVGMARMHKTMGDVYEGRVFCLPEDALPTRDAAIDQFVEWGENNPGEKYLPPVDGLLTWLAQTYPCN